MPAPPASASNVKTSLTSVGSTPIASAIPAQTPATTRSSSLRRSLNGIALMLRRARDLDVADADTRVDQELRRGGADVARHVVTVLVAAEQGRVAPADVPEHAHGCVVRNRHVELADADSRVDGRRLGAEWELREVE